MIRYLDEKLKSKDSEIEKLRLRNITLKAHTQKVASQLKQKEEMGDVLHYIDFHQLQIENKQHLSRIDERNQELLKLKLSTGNTVQVLNNLKQELNELTVESDWVQNEILSRTTLGQKVEAETKRVEIEISKEKKIEAKLTDASEDGVNMPHTLDYVAQKAEMYELQGQMKVRLCCYVSS